MSLSERERRNRHWFFFLYFFFFVFLTYLFPIFVFTGLCLMGNLISELTPKAVGGGGMIFVYLYIFVADIQVSSLTLRVRLLAHFLTCAIRFQLYYICAEDFGPRVFLSFLITVIAISVFSYYYFLLSLPLSLFPPKLVTRSLHNLDLTYHVISWLSM